MEDNINKCANVDINIVCLCSKEVKALLKQKVFIED